MRLALVTYSGLPGLSEDDRLVVGPLAARGISAEPAAWDDPAVEWDSYDALVVRSTWNYHRSFDAFRAWIDRVEALGVPLWNPAALLRWNASKTYLRDLVGRGVRVLPTHWVERGSATDLAEVLAGEGWSDAVVKPAISASAYETWRVAARRLRVEDDSRFRGLTGEGDVMVQPFLPELARDGEWSMIFLAGEYSHAVLKRPRRGDFRVQHEHGGTAEACAPPGHLTAAAREITAAVPAPWLYARVDGCEVAGQFVLVELEMLEPSLFLASAASAAERFADAIAQRL